MAEYRLLFEASNIQRINQYRYNISAFYNECGVLHGLYTMEGAITTDASVDLTRSKTIDFILYENGRAKFGIIQMRNIRYYDEYGIIYPEEMHTKIQKSSAYYKERNLYGRQETFIGSRGADLYDMEYLLVDSVRGHCNISTEKLPYPKRYAKFAFANYLATKSGPNDWDVSLYPTDKLLHLYAAAQMKRHTRDAFIKYMLGIGVVLHDIDIFDLKFDPELDLCGHPFADVLFVFTFEYI